MVNKKLIELPEDILFAGDEWFLVTDDDGLSKKLYTGRVKSYIDDGLVTLSGTLVTYVDSIDRDDYLNKYGTVALVDGYIPTVSGSVVSSGWLEQRLAEGAQSDNFVSIQLTPQETPPAYSEGLIYYDSEYGALTVYNGFSATALQVGQEIYAKVKNVTDTTILNGSVVNIVNASGDKPTVELAFAGAFDQCKCTLGLATMNIPPNNSGLVTTTGMVNDIDTSAFAEGQRLYLSATVSGAMTIVPPSEPNHLVRIGMCTRAHASTGKIFVNMAAYQDSDLTYEGTEHLYFTEDRVAASAAVTSLLVTTGTNTTNISNNTSAINALADTVSNLTGHPQVVTATISGTYTPNLDTYNFFDLTVSGSVTISNPTTELIGRSGILSMKQDSIGGHTIDFSSDWIFPAGQPAENQAPNAWNLFRYTTLAQDKIYVEFAADFL